MVGACTAPAFIVFGGVFLLLLLSLPFALWFNSLLGIPWAGAAFNGLVSSAIMLLLAASGGMLFYWRGRGRRLLELGAGMAWHRLAGVEVGPKARHLHQLATEGQPVAQGWALPAACAREPRKAAVKIVRACGIRGIETVLVRSSFSQEDGGLLYPGVFRSELNVSAQDAGALEAAIRRVGASARSELSGRYRDRLDSTATGPDISAAVLVQEQLALDCHGVICSIHPQHRRPDEILLEAGEPGGQPAMDIYSWVLNRWLSRHAPLDQENRDLLLQALRHGEALLGRPVVMEFGVHRGSLVLLQLRSAPSVPLRQVWIQSGPVLLNPDPLPRAQADILYGPGLEVIEEAITRALADLMGSGAEQPRVELCIHQDRPVIEFAALARAMRHAPRRYSPAGLLWEAAARARRARRAARAVMARGSSSDPALDIQERARAQARVHGAAEMLRRLGQSLDAATADRSRFAPFVPWHRAIRLWVRLRVRQLARLREALHEDMMQRLRRVAGQDPDPPPVDPLPPILLGPAGQLTPAATEEGQAAPADTPMVLDALIPGQARGVVAWPDQPEQCAGMVLLLADASTRWLPHILEAEAVLMVGGHQALSHLALMLFELNKPTLVGLTPDEAEGMVGQEVAIEGDTLRIVST